MGITAMALLKIRDLALPPEAGMRVEQLEDAVLIHTGESFALEPEELGDVLLDAVGAAITDHADPRGIFFLPDVAAPKARTYVGVIAEVADGGVWAQLGDMLESFGPGDGLGALGAVLSSMIQYMPEAVVEAASAAAQG